MLDQHEEVSGLSTASRYNAFQHLRFGAFYGGSWSELYLEWELALWLHLNQISKVDIRCNYHLHARVHTCARALTREFGVLLPITTVYRCPQKYDYSHALFKSWSTGTKDTYLCTASHSHSTVHQTGRFYCLTPAVCSLHHRCRSLQSCKLYWRDCAGHLKEYQDHHSWWLRLDKSNIE